MLDKDVYDMPVDSVGHPPAGRLLILTRVGLLFQSSLEEEWVQRVLLSACTAGERLGFNRALLFSYDKKENLLRGSAAMGHLTWEETEEVWDWIREHKLGLEDFLASHRSGNFQYGGALHRKVRELRIRVRDGGGILSRTFLEKRSFGPKQIAGEEALEKPLYDVLKTAKTATCPLMRGEDVLGVVVVDNRFTGKAIEEEDMQMLSILCGQAGVAIHNAGLFAQVEKLNAELQNRVFAVGEDLVTLNRQLLKSHDELRDAQAELIRKDRLAFLGEMAAIVAHEIRNPLTSIRGFAQRIQRRCQGAVEATRTGEDAEIIMEEVDRLHRVLRDVLELARRSSPKPEKTDLNAIIRDTLALVGFGYGKLSTVQELQESLPKVKVDAEQMKQVLLNLFRNAIQAMNGEGRLMVRTRPVYNGVEVEVSDTGPGIPDDVIGNIFQPFFTTKPHGTGLGLSLVQRIVEDHRGQVTVESEVGKGATFRIRLPIAPP